MLPVLLLSAITACLSYTLAESKFLLPFRARLSVLHRFLGHLACCGYCLGHWLAFLLVLLCNPPLPPLSTLPPLHYVLGSLFTAWLAALQWNLLCCLMRLAQK